MWSWVACYLFGHQDALCRESGAMFLRCVVCGRRSAGWLVHARGGHARADGPVTHVRDALRQPDKVSAA